MKKMIWCKIFNGYWTLYMRLFKKFLIRLIYEPFKWHQTSNWNWTLNEIFVSFGNLEVNTWIDQHFFLFKSHKKMNNKYNIWSITWWNKKKESMYATFLSKTHFNVMINVLMSGNKIVKYNNIYIYRSVIWSVNFCLSFVWWSYFN